MANSKAKVAKTESLEYFDWRTFFNRPLPSSKNPYFQNEAKCTTFLGKMSFICKRMKYNFHIKGCGALNLDLIERHGETRKSPIAFKSHYLDRKKK